MKNDGNQTFFSKMKTCLGKITTKVMLRKKVIIAAVVVVGVLGTTLTTVYIKSKAAAVAESAVVLDTVILKKMDLEKTISLSGKIKSNDSQTVTSAISDATIKSVPVEVGSVVKPGDILCVLDSTTYENQKELAEVSAGIAGDKSEISVETAERNLEETAKTKEIEAARVQNASVAANTDYNKAVADSTTKKSDYENAVSNTKQKETDKNNAASALENAKNNLITKKRAYEEKSSTYKDTEASTKITEAKAAVSAAESKLATAQSELKKAQDAQALLLADPAATADQKSAAQTEVDTKNQSVTDAQTALDQVKKSQADLEASYSSVQSAIGNAKREYEDADTEVSKRQTAYETAASNYAIAQTDETTKKSAYETSTSTIKSSKQTYEEKLQTQDDTIRKNEKSVEDTANTVQSSQLDSKLTTVENAQKIKDLQKKIDDCTIKAVKGGVVTSVLVKTGDSFKGGDVVTIQDASSFQVGAAVGQADVSDVAGEMPVRIKSDATGDLEMTGQITFVAPLPQSETSSSKTTSTTTTTTTNTTDYEIRTSIQNPSERLRLGMTVKVTIIEKTAKNVFALPSKYITTDENEESYITIIDKEKNQKKIKVTKGLETDYYIEITSEELKEGMEVLAPEETVQEAGSDSTDVIFF